MNLDYSDNIIEVKDLYKIYTIGENKVRALNGVDFCIKRGEFVAVVGQSGSGKSTLLNMLAGLEKPTKGQVIIAGEHIENKNEAGLVLFRQKHVGFIFQSYNLLQNMDAVENVAMPLVFRGEDKEIREMKARRMLKQVGLAKYLDHRPGQMSGGQQQRVGIARALVVNPEIIFADEPTGNLDSNTSLEVMHLMQNISRKKNQTIVMVTHDDYLAGFADKIIRILDGKVIDIKINERKDPVETPKEETPKEEPKEETKEETEEITAEKTDNAETAEQENTQA
ncbi:MAG: ABC transporter ATP-binding protein [Lachnospiraceae bacterium]|nr:ABC transporter ATP-binding protein [Lachnospiraceae bacterium]